jgi:hypothetical protein
MGYSRDEWCVLAPSSTHAFLSLSAPRLLRARSGGPHVSEVVGCAWPSHAHRIELASSAGFPSLLDPSSGYTGGPGAKAGLTLPRPMQMQMSAKPGWNTGSTVSQPPRSAYSSKPLGPKPKGGRSPRRGPRSAPRGGPPRSGGSQWDRPLARSWDRPLVRSRMYSSIDSTSSNGGGGRSSMHHSGPFDYHAPLARPALATPGEKRPDTSPAHLALESQVQSALKELNGVMEEGVKMFDVPPATAGARSSTGGGDLSSEENAALVSRLKDQIRSTDALVKKLYARNASLEQQMEEMEAQAEEREEAEAGAAAAGGGSEEVAQLRLLAAEKERFIEELQGQLVVTVQEKEAEAAAQADRANAELRAVQAELEVARGAGAAATGGDADVAAAAAAAAGGSLGSPGSPSGGGSLGMGGSAKGSGSGARGGSLEDAPAIGSMVGRELAAHYYGKYKEMASQFDTLLRRRTDWVRSSTEGPAESRQLASIVAALEARRLQVGEEVALEGQLQRAEISELEEQLCQGHVDSVRGTKEVDRLRGEMEKRDKLDKDIRAMVERLTSRVNDLEAENRRLKATMLG